MLGIIAIEVGEEVEVAAEVEVEVEADEVAVAVAVIAEAIEAIEAEIENEIVAVIGEGEVIIIIIVSIVEVEDIKSSIHQCSMGLLNVAVCFIEVSSAFPNKTTYVHLQCDCGMILHWIIPQSHCWFQHLDY